MDIVLTWLMLWTCSLAEEKKNVMKTSGRKQLRMKELGRVLHVVNSLRQCGWIPLGITRLDVRIGIFGKSIRRRVSVA